MVLVTEDTSGLDIRQPVKRRLSTFPRFTLFFSFSENLRWRSLGYLVRGGQLDQVGQLGQGGRRDGGGAGIGGQVAAPVHLSWRRARPRIHQLPSCPQTTLPRPPPQNPPASSDRSRGREARPMLRSKAQIHYQPQNWSLPLISFQRPAFFVIDI